MKARSKDYVSLQTLYRRKAQSDLAEVTKSVRSLEKSLERPNAIDLKEIEAFCKGAASARVVHGRKVLGPPTTKCQDADESERWRVFARKIVMENQQQSDGLVPGEESLLATLIALWAFDIVIEREDKIPFPRPQDKEGKFEEALKKESSRLMRAMDTGEVVTGDDVGPLETRVLHVAEELGRAGGAELHNISALTGGAVAQEVIKVVTKQYVPVDNTSVFDGVTSRSETFRL